MGPGLVVSCCSITTVGAEVEENGIKWIESTERKIGVAPTKKWGYYMPCAPPRQLSIATYTSIVAMATTLSPMQNRLMRIGRMQIVLMKENGYSFSFFQKHIFHLARYKTRLRIICLHNAKRKKCKKKNINKKNEANFKRIKFR